MFQKFFRLFFFVLLVSFCCSSIKVAAPCCGSETALAPEIEAYFEEGDDLYILTFGSRCIPDCCYDRNVCCCVGSVGIVGAGCAGIPASMYISLHGGCSGIGGALSAGGMMFCWLAGPALCCVALASYNRERDDRSRTPQLGFAGCIGLRAPHGVVRCRPSVTMPHWLVRSLNTDDFQLEDNESFTITYIPRKIRRAHLRSVGRVLHQRQISMTPIHFIVLFGTPELLRTALDQCENLTNPNLTLDLSFPNNLVFTRTERVCCVEWGDYCCHEDHCVCPHGRFRYYGGWCPEDWEINLPSGFRCNGERYFCTYQRTFGQPLPGDTLPLTPLELARSLGKQEMLELLEEAESEYYSETDASTNSQSSSYYSLASPYYSPASDSRETESVTDCAICQPKNKKRTRNRRRLGKSSSS